MDPVIDEKSSDEPQLESYGQMYERFKKEFLPKAHEQHQAQAIARDRKRLVIREVSRQAIANTLGTVIGGGILILIGRLGGLLREISPAGLMVITVTVLIAASALLYLARQRPNTPEEEAADAAARLTRLQMEADVISRQHRPE